VIVEQGDVSREEDVRRVLDRIDRELPPLRGVLHAAMVLDDDPLVELDQRRFRRVLEPKVAGAWNLHRLTLDAPLDLFVLFSSVASVIGHPLQGNYSAANAFLDALAWHRRALGMSAHTIGWGVLSDVGYVARHPEISQHLDRAGLVPMAPSEALATLGGLLRHDLPHVIAARVEWQKWAQLNSFAAASRRFARFVGAAEPAEAQQPDGEGALSRLRAAGGEERHALMEAYLAGGIAKVLGTTPEKVGAERPLTELGFDSLMAVELVTAINSDLGVRVQVVKILEGTSARRLAATLLAALALDASPPAETAPDPDAAPQTDTAPDPDDGAQTDTAPDPDDGAPQAVTTPAAIGTSERAGLPLSSEQRRFWFLEQLEPGNPAYHLHAAARLTGRLDVGVLRRCLDELLRRHEVLRSSFETRGGDPLRTVVPPMPAPLFEHDVTRLDVEEREAALQRIATEEIRRPFDLAGPPLLRCALVRLGAAEHALVLIVHHIAAEAWAVTLLVRELMTLYGDLASGRPPGLSEPAARYDDYVTRQAETLDEQHVRAQRSYWERRLAGLPSELPLLTDRPRPAVPARDGRRRHFRLSVELSDGLRDLARREGTTLFTTLLAAFQTLLHRHSGATDLSVGTAVAIRDLPGLAEVVGPCMNTLVLRTDLSGDPSFRALLRRARETTLGAFAHRDLPYERVVEALRPQRAAGRSPLFQTMLIMHDARVPELRMAGLHIEPLEVDAEAPIADVTLFIGNGVPLRGALEYDAELFDEASVDRLVDQLLRLLAGIVAEPDRPLSALPVAGDEERRLVTTDWNDTAAADAAEVSLHALFDEQAARSPEAVAVTAGDQSVTYRELRARSGRLARYLRGAGVGPGVVVGVLLERSLDAVVAALATVEAGGVYLPLDPDDPPERLRTVVADARAHLLLARAPAAEARSLGARLIDLDAEREAIDRLDAAPLVSGSGPDDPAYAIYTSGSTGTPKGVAIPHRAICNQVRWRQAAFALTPDDAVLLHTELGFDPSVWEIFGPLSAGARLVVRHPRPRATAPASSRRSPSTEVSVVQVVPSLLDALLEEPGFGAARAFGT
jgi:non-ribosomal peptide synthetase component F/acyl carrier protein